MGYRLVRDEVGDVARAREEGKEWYVVRLTHFKDGVEEEYRWVVWSIDLLELLEFMKEVGLSYDRCEPGVVSVKVREATFYRGDVPVGKLFVAPDVRCYMR